MNNRYRLASLGLLLILSLTLTATPIAAAQTLAAPGAQRELPPLPEWPIIGPILRMLGVGRAAAPAAPTLDPTLPEFHIRSWDDVKALEQIEPGERVRVIASDTDINRIAQEAIRERADENLSFRVDFGANQATIEASADAALVEQTGLSLPALIRGALRVELVGSATAENCRPIPDIQSLKVNGWGIGLRAIAQRAVDTQLPESWPSDICIEQILLMEGEAAVEGYRIP